jgi:putative transposase
MPPRRRKATIRLPGYDYSRDGLYFVTSCVQGMACRFGYVVNGEMKLNDAGLIAADQWDWLLNRFPYLKSHAFVVMPNHIHAVLEINRGLLREKNAALSESESALATDRSRPVRSQSQEDLYPDSLQFEQIKAPTNESHLLDQPIKIKPLDQVLGAYKTTSSKMIHAIGLTDFQWMRSYYDHIIRAEAAYHRIVSYINTNPERWEEDKFYRS